MRQRFLCYEGAFSKVPLCASESCPVVLLVYLENF